MKSVIYPWNMKCPEPCGFRVGVRKWLSGQTGPLTVFIKKVFWEHSCPSPLVYMLSRLHLMAEWNAAERTGAHKAQNIYYLKFPFTEKVPQPLIQAFTLILQSIFRREKDTHPKITTLILISSSLHPEFLFHPPLLLRIQQLLIKNLPNVKFALRSCGRQNQWGLCPSLQYYPFCESLPGNFPGNMATSSFVFPQLFICFTPSAFIPFYLGQRFLKTVF